ncbi:2-succinyl-6-hydroxy-2,4-cyclohexadiene-1-carboxylate synthase [Shewanella sp. HN-41]|uniref:2-succinyl-6-hydroxy-2, 4-cyclohexadiene-1-carboxylate synthase n=1 Tax=Shewanella sp. HN-41 TaxID=327275 RepID=UPI0002125E60|nr:2-succinyl-6-hydroxy-2,4-cyclohexadiene-1-carboxylate synthase [Shewanella sp. HN-41]EGM67985.1 2-succinyl-6-hydroxy-2,4-cyclohexadiene-1- carboxylate synthase [Shewanella sp. HN-41]
MPTLTRYGETILPTLVLLHGFLGTKADWLPLMPKLSQHFHCVCLDLVGHGDNQPSLPAPEMEEGFSFCVQDIIARLDRLNISQFHLYGYSLGGRIALHLAKTHPQRLLSLLLESCHPGLKDPQEKAARTQNDAHWAERLLKLSSMDFLSLWYQQTVFAQMNQSCRESTITMRASMLDKHPKHILKEMYLATSLARQASMWDVPAMLSCECHFFAGSQDTKFHTLAQEWQLHSPILVHSIRGAGHNIHQSTPAALIAAILALLAPELPHHCHINI